MKRLSRFAAAAVALAAFAGAGPAQQAPDKGPRVLILDENAKTPQDFQHRQGPRGIVGLIDRFRKGLPKGYKARIVMSKFYNANYGKFDDMVVSMTPLDPAGKSDGVEQHFDAASGLVRTATYKKGVQDGEEKFYERGPRWTPYVKKVVPWKEGRTDGVVRTYYPGGKLMAESPYVQGKLEGLSKSYNEDGFVTRSVIYKGGKKHGMMTEHWSRTRKCKSRIPYEMGKVHGTARQYHENGKRKKEVQLWEGKYHGIEKVYHEDGEVRSVRYWILDDDVSKAEFEKTYRVPPVPRKKPPTTKPAGAATSKPAAAGE